MILDSDKAYDFKEKTQKEFPDFTNSVDHLQVKDLESNLIAFTKYLEEILFSLKHDTAIKELSSKVSALNKPYADKINFYKGKNRELSKFIDDGVADPAALKLAMVEYSKLAVREELKKDQDSELKGIKDDLRDLKSSFLEGKKEVTAKIKYINILILEKDPEQGFENNEKESN